MNRILIVEDEGPIANLVAMHLTESGYLCQWAADGDRALELIDSQPFDLILLDVMLPQVDGFELMEYIHPLGIPVIFLTAKGDVAHRVHGLKLGADDYLTKPFDMVELLARVESVLRRYHKTQQLFTLGPVTIDIPSRQVSLDNQPVSLTNKEFELLLLFVQNKNIALYRETIYERIWGGFFSGDSRTVDLHVQRLRKKLHWEDCLTAVYKVGYRLEVNP